MTEPDDENGNSFNVSLFGQSFSGRGKDALLLLVVLALVAVAGAVAWINREGFASLEARELARAEAVYLSGEARRHEHEDLRESLDALTFVLTLTPDERKALGLTMPQRLREMTKR